MEESWESLGAPKTTRMNSPRRRYRRQAIYLALVWLRLAPCFAAVSLLDSTAGAEKPSLLDHPLSSATTATATRMRAETLLQTVGCGDTCSHDGQIACTPIPTSGRVPSCGADPAYLSHGQSAYLIVVSINGGASLRRNRNRKAQREEQQQLGLRSPSQLRSILKKCLARAGSGGIPGAVAGVLQVVTLMWLRTIVNYQCRYGTSIRAAASELYQQGGVLRFYRGVIFALVSNPLSRFGMAAANEGALAITDALPREFSVTFTTWLASLFAGLWRVMLTPLDTCKTVLQVEGPKGFASLMRKVWAGNFSCLYQGAMAAAAATAVGYFPWFLTFNYLNARVGKPSAMVRMLLRNAAIGLASSIASDVCSNFIRVLKTTKQAAAAYDARVTYGGAAALVIEKDGLLGLFGRGLLTRILANGLQSMLFTVVWRYLHDKYVVPRHQAADMRETRVLSVSGTEDGNRRHKWEWRGKDHPPRKK